jgi:hypothetical protein
MEAKFGPIDEVLQQATIGPLIRRRAGPAGHPAIILGSIGILAWMTFASPTSHGAPPPSWLLHDVIVVVGTFAILGTFAGCRLTRCS